MSLLKLANEILPTDIEQIYVDDVFSTYLYTGTSSEQNIVNDIDLANEGGIVWLKGRNLAVSNLIWDTVDGISVGPLDTSNPNERYTNTPKTLTTFNADGFSMQDDSTSFGENVSSRSQVSWTFRKAPKFFDVVKYTGDGVAGRAISHNLGITPGMIIVKRANDVANWVVYHKSIGAIKRMYLNQTAGEETAVTWNDTEPTDTQFYLGTYAENNALGDTYIAYLFAHDPDVDTGMIQCGNFITDVTGYASITTGWETQYILYKDTTGGGSWNIIDSMRDMPVDGTGLCLQANNHYAENTIGRIAPSALGFSSIGISPIQSGIGYIYMAIRRPMRTPDSSSEVFAIDESPNANTPRFISGFAVDMGMYKKAANTVGIIMGARLINGKKLDLYQDTAEGILTTNSFDYPNGWDNDTDAATGFFSWMWKRATGFFDVVSFEAGGVISDWTEPHNLGVPPEMMWVKTRESSGSWWVYHKDMLNTQWLYLNTDDMKGTSGAAVWATTDTTFGQASSGMGLPSFQQVIAYLFATVSGISKVGSFSHVQATPTDVSCGFTAGSRFILVKRTDDTGDWFFWDTVRGITTGADSTLRLNTTQAEESLNYISPFAAGFTATGLPTGDYIFYAIA